tara:strand:- start:800 stop:1042 length:243 start_codon:yes stop_codon:yes gene_type:complete
MNENNLRLTDVQTKAIKCLAKADARPVKQMLSMVLKEGFYWIFNEFHENSSPHLGWPDEWKEINQQLQEEYKKALEVNND